MNWYATTHQMHQRKQETAQHARTAYLLQTDQPTARRGSVLAWLGRLLEGTGRRLQGRAAYRITVERGDAAA